jgi:nicotinate-nucleotide adenylyltransferase
MNTGPDRTSLLFGGTFDPIHNGHLKIIRSLHERGLADETILLPAAIPPHKLDRKISDASHRLAMLRLAISGSDDIRLSEYEIKKDDISYTIRSARHFSEELEERLLILIGTDSLEQLHTWHQAGDLVAEFHFLVYRRPGTNIPERATLAAHFGDNDAQRLLDSVVDGDSFPESGTEIRRRVREGLDIEGMVPAAVCDYIRDHQLYREP